MGIRASIKLANARFFEFTGIAILFALVLGLGGPVTKAGFAWAGSSLQQQWMPALAEREVALRDAEGNIKLRATLPAFEIKEQRWDGDDLLLVDGTLCKAYDYDFENVKLAYGSPDGIIQPAPIVFRNPSGTRIEGCQRWSNWLLVGAKQAIDNKWFLVVTHRPKHGLWSLRQTIGPYPFPARSIN